MGMVAFPNSGTIMTAESLKTLPTAGPIFTELMSILEANDVDERILDDNWSCSFDPDEVEEHIVDQINTFLHDLIEAFNKDTGLTVTPMYYSEDDGDRYDDLEGDGIYWIVDGVYQYTPEAERIKNMLMDVRWTVYG